MNLLISFFYAPMVFLSLRYFDITQVALLVFLFSFFWFLLVYKKGYKEYLYPLLYICIAILAFFFEDFLVLKAMPLIISSLITSFILLSYLTKKSIIIYFAKKFTKNEISKKEQEYIHKSTLFWFFISLTNVIIHLFIYLDTNTKFWMYYSSFGWYFIFIFAGILQYLHKKFIFQKGL